MTTDVFSPVTVFWGQLYHLLVYITFGLGTLQHPFLLFTFSLLILYEAEEDTGLSPDLCHQLGHLQYIYSQLFCINPGSFRSSLLQVGQLSAFPSAGTGSNAGKRRVGRE